MATGAGGGFPTATLQNLYTLDQLKNVMYFEFAAPANGLPGFDKGAVEFLANLNRAFTLSLSALLEYTDNITYEDVTGGTSHRVV